MIVCCNKEMKVEKNGVGVEAGSEVYPGDRYVCMVCHRTVVVTCNHGNDFPRGGLSDPNHEAFSEYVVLKQ